MKLDDTRHRRGLVATRVCGAFLALYLAFAPGPAATQKLQVIELHYRLADAVTPTLQPLLEPGGVLTGMDNMLFVRTGPANFEQIRQAVAMLDRRPRQLTISVGQGTVATDSGAGVRGSATVIGTETMFQPRRTAYCLVTSAESVTRAIQTLSAVPSIGSCTRCASASPSRASPAATA